MMRRLLHALETAAICVASPFAFAVAWCAVKHCELTVRENHLTDALARFPEYGLSWDHDAKELVLTQCRCGLLYFAGTKVPVDELRFKAVVRPKVMR